MCGVFGVIDTRGVNVQGLISMSRTLAHRGPDDEGFLLCQLDGGTSEFVGEDSMDILRFNMKRIEEYGSENFIVGLGHRRLSIIDLSYMGHQPMSYAERFTISYNGEIYNYKEIRSTLMQKGYMFDSKTDTEVILKAYDCWGEEMVHRFIGMWVIVICDLQKKVLFISRDRFGIKPFYYNLSRGRLVFASEIKALFNYPGVEKRVQDEYLIQFIVNGVEPLNGKTVFEGVEELSPGCNMTISYSSLDYKIKRYYQLEHQIDQCRRENLTEKESVEKFECLFENSIALQMRSDVEVGSCLSGGLDSSAITTFAVNQIGSDASFNTFTAAYNEPEIDESNYARSVVKYLQNVKGSYIFPSSKNFFEDFGKLAYQQDLPVGSSSIYAQWEVMKLAKANGIKVLLDGQGADEILGGYGYFSGVYLLDLLKKGKWRSFSIAAKALKKNRGISVLRELGRAVFPQLPLNLQKLVRKERRLGYHFITPQYRNTVLQTQVDKYHNTFEGRSIWAVNNSLKRLLRYEDRNSMAFSIEARVPYLDHRLVEYAIAIPAEYKINNGWTKYILRKTIDSRLPSNITWRRDKKGFETPQSKWKEELEVKVIDFVGGARWPDYIDSEAIMKFCALPLNSSSSLSEFWRIISVLQWMEQYKLV